MKHPVHILILVLLTFLSPTVQAEPAKREVHTVPGLGKFYLEDPNDYVQAFLRRGEIWEPTQQKLFEKYIQSGDVVVDAGAFVGSHTLKLAKLAAPGKVHAFEPQEKLPQLIADNMRLNNLTNVQVYPVALGGKNCQTTMKYINHGNKGASPISGCLPNEENGTELRTIDSFRFQHVDFMKIDVEGFELEVLKGAEKTLKRDMPVLMIEIGFVNQKRVLPYIESLGYKLNQFIPQEFLAVPIFARG